MRRVLPLVVLALGLVRAAETDWRWDFLPAACYHDEELCFALRPDPQAGPPGPLALVVGPDGRSASLALGEDGAWSGRLTVGRGDGTVQLRAAGGSVALRFLRPGESAGLHMDAGRLRDAAGCWVILVCERQEATEDRRWALLRSRQPTIDRRPCDLHLPAVHERSIAEGGLLDLVAALQGRDLGDHRLLLELPNTDAYRGWRHRRYRQVLAWLVADCRQRGVRRLVLVQPPIVALDDGRLAGLRDQVYDVGRSYRCEVLALPGLEAQRYWELIPGILGRGLNEDGRAAVDALCAPYLR